YFCCEKIIDEALSEAAILPFQQLHYLVQLVRGITRLGCPADEQSTRSLLQYLLFLNCNDPLIIENALLFWEKKANATNSIPEAIEQWMDAEQEILIWQQEQKPGLYTHKQSCGEVLLVLVKKSIQKLELWMQLQASAKEEKNCKKLHTCLNLSELAIVLRLLQETGVIRHTVMMEFLRCWAAWVEMEPGKPIAVDSLKTRYYSPEPAALRKIKDLFMEMRHKLAQW
ncbi:hypothetical protein, partial [Hydrotalea flava]|uniref:hypothetical protein n=1 Tax=Hydrotalea flava TaxID=714549 RepID=UPI00142ED4CD